jgi:hypothetical protein
VWNAAKVIGCFHGGSFFGDGCGDKLVQGDIVTLGELSHAPLKGWRKF